MILWLETLETLGLVRRITCIPSWDDDGDGCRFGLMRESSRNGVAGIKSDVRGESTKVGEFYSFEYCDDEYCGLIR